MKVENAYGTHVACRMLSIELEKKQKKNNARKYRKCGNKSLIILQTLLGFPKQHSISQKLSEIRQQICLQSPSKSNVHTHSMWIIYFNHSRQEGFAHKLSAISKQKSMKIRGKTQKI